VSLDPGTRVGKYVIRRKLAEGGMAEIYLATFRGPGGFEKEVVIKRIRSFLATDPSFVDMFITEARVASRLNHANLVQIFDFDKHEDTYYLAMEYVRGHSLWDLRERANKMSTGIAPILAAHIAAELARGLHYAHRLTDRTGKPLGLVHRDVTPHNVLLSYDGAVKLTDFGVAKAGSSQSTSGMLKGKFAYMSPEQARGDEVDAKTDIFAVGILLWEMLTDSKLFEGDSDVALLRAVQTAEISPPSSKNKNLPLQLDDIVLKALNRDPAERYPTAEALERALAQFVLGHAKSLEDTDSGAFLRELFPNELAASEAPRESTSSMEQTPLRERTAVMNGAAGRREHWPRPGEAKAPADEEDLEGKTHQLPRPSLEPSLLSRTLDGKKGAAKRGRGRRALIGLGSLLVLSLAFGVGIRIWQLQRSGQLQTAPPAVPPAEAAVQVVAPQQENRPEATSATPDAVNVALPKVEPGAQAMNAVEPKEAERKGEEDKGKKEVEAPAETAVLTLRVTPWANVYIDGKRKGEVIGRGTFRLPAGTHRIRLVHSSSTKEAVVTLRPGQRTVQEFSFLPLR
jgi:serine/threonine-protein kinase